MVRVVFETISTHLRIDDVCDLCVVGRTTRDSAADLTPLSDCQKIVPVPGRSAWRSRGQIPSQHVTGCVRRILGALWPGHAPNSTSEPRCSWACGLKTYRLASDKIATLRRRKSIHKFIF